VAIGPLSPQARRGGVAKDTTNPNTEEAIQRTWTFLQGLKAKTLTLYGLSAAAGRMLVAETSGGKLTFSDKVASVRLARTGGTITENATLITAASGEYLVTVYGQCTTAGAAGTLTVTFDYTDDVGLTVTGNVISLVLTGTGRAYGTAVLRCAGGGIDYNLTVTGAVGGPVYSVHLDVVRVG
jgi:hypothetical protein